MALCDYLISADITGYDCEHPAVKGAESVGLLINRSDIDQYTDSGFQRTITLKCGSKQAWKITQSGKTPFNGTQQEMVEGTYQNTITNTVQFVVLKHNEDTAIDLFCLANGDFVAVIPNKDGTYQVYGSETGLRATGAVRELYNDDTLAGWQITFTEEGAVKGNLFTTAANFTALQSATAACPQPH